MNLKKFITIKVHGLQHTTTTLHIVYTHILSFKWAIICIYLKIERVRSSEVGWLVCNPTDLPSRISCPSHCPHVKLITLWWVQCHHHCHKWWSGVIHKNYRLRSKLYCLSFPLAQRKMMHFSHNHNLSVTAHLNERMKKKSNNIYSSNDSFLRQVHMGSWEVCC